MGYAADGFITDVKEIGRKEYLKNTHIKHTISVKKDKEQKQLEISENSNKKKKKEQKSRQNTKMCNRSTNAPKKKMKYIKQKS